jgi:hypothetical protein
LKAGNIHGNMKALVEKRCGSSIVMEVFKLVVVWFHIVVMVYT